MNKSSNGIQPEDIDQILKVIGARIRAKRKEVENNYEVFAEKHHINKVTLARVENGANSSLKTIILVANAVDLKLSDLFRDIN